MELKFRAWHKKRKKYLNAVASIEFENKELWVNENGYAGVYLFDEVIIEQYTGIKDKNGKEIYVGDIVKYTHDWEISADEEEVGVVEYYNGGFSPMQLVNGGVHYVLDSDPIYEVIGNIHDKEE